jgi:hypothetical protein
MPTGTRRAEAIVFVMGTGLLVHDSDGVLVQCNPAAERLLELTKDDVDRSWRTRAARYGGARGPEDVAMDSLTVGEAVENVVLPLPRRGRAPLWVSVSAVPMRASTDTPPLGVVTTLSDVTFLRRRDRPEPPSRPGDGARDTAWPRTMCMHCKGVRDDGGAWQRIEAFLATTAAMKFSHGICPHCVFVHHPEAAGPEQDG